MSNCLSANLKKIESEKCTFWQFNTCYHGEKWHFCWVEDAKPLVLNWVLSPRPAQNALLGPLLLHLHFPTWLRLWKCWRTFFSETIFSKLASRNFDFISLFYSKDHRERHIKKSPRTWVEFLGIVCVVLSKVIKKSKKV